MSSNGVMPMDSYRLAQYAVPTPCFICGGNNNFDAELCRHCQAPMALARQATEKKHQPQMVATLGSADSGKTVYLGMLTDMLSRKSGRLQLLARGAFSVSLQQNTMAALASRDFPTKTPNEPDRWNWVHCQAKINGRRKPLEMIMPDVAGEALAEEIEHAGAYPVVRAFLSKCTGVLILVDVAEVETGQQDQDFFTMKLVSYLCELNSDNKKGWCQRPVSVVFTKADQCEACVLDPVEYARKHTPGLWQQCHERLHKHRFFAASVAGSCGYATELGGRRQIPLRVEPRGIVEPFAWVVDNLPSK